MGDPSHPTHNPWFGLLGEEKWGIRAGLSLWCE